MTNLSIDRTQRLKLTDQLTDALRNKILSGELAAGQMLPKLRDLADQVGVSLIVATAAMRRLTEEGLVVPRKRVGTIVASQGVRPWRGRVIFVCPTEHGAYFPNALAGSLAKRFLSNGFLFQRVTLEHINANEYDYAFLDYLLRESTDLVIQLYNNLNVSRHLQKCGAPFVVIREHGRPPRGSVGDILIDRWPDLADIARQWCLEGVRTVEVAGQESRIDVVRALTAAELAVRERVIAPDLNYGYIDGTERAAMEYYMAHLKTDRLPDLYFFTDDYFAAGALTAFADKGMRVPKQVKVVTHANKRLGPVYTRALTRYELDPVAIGDTIAEYLLTSLRTKRFDGRCSPSSIYFKGETA